MRYASFWDDRIGTQMCADNEFPVSFAILVLIFTFWSLNNFPSSSLTWTFKNFWLQLIFFNDLRNFEDAFPKRVT